MLNLPTIAAKEEVIIPSSVVIMEITELLSVVVITTGSRIFNSLAYLISDLYWLGALRHSSCHWAQGEKESH